MTMLGVIVRYRKGIEMKEFEKVKKFEKWWDISCCIGDAEALEKSKPRYQTGFYAGCRVTLKWILSCNTGPETKELIERVLNNE